MTTHTEKSHANRILILLLLKKMAPWCLWAALFTKHSHEICFSYSDKTLGYYGSWMKLKQDKTLHKDRQI